MTENSNSFNPRVAVVGLGYVGLPLAVEFGKIYPTIGFDINPHRVDDLLHGHDRTRQIRKEEILGSEFLQLSAKLEDIKSCTIFIITVPTPIDRYKKPDLTLLLNASEMIGQVLKKGDIVVYESTVYPGCTEEDCVPVLEKFSSLVFNQDFFCGYSPERINPGDKINTLRTIRKVISASNGEALDYLEKLYNSIILAGTYKAGSIKVAEACKVIENAQRDVNISFVNELSLIFDRMNIDTFEVLEAASTKWNFLNFKPGLVGGHCIGVDPYYLVHKAESLGYYTQVILSGRRINDNMGMFVAGKVVKMIIKSGVRVDQARALILGFSFKENCPDIRNSRVIDIYNELRQFNVEVDIYDPWVDRDEALEEYGVHLLESLDHESYDAIILAVAHSEFLDIDFSRLKRKQGSIIFDTKALLERDLVDARL